LYIDTADKFAQVSINHADYMRHIVSHFAAERMKHVKHYQKEALSNYRAGGPVRREYPHDAGMAGKTKATTKGSPVEIKEIKRITNYAMSVAGGQGYQPGGRFLVAFNRRGYFSTKASRANRVGLVSGCGLSNNLLCRCAFSRCRSSMDNAISCSSSFVIVCTCKAVRRNTPRYSDDGFCCCNLLRWFFLPLRNTSSGGGSLVFSGGVNFSCLVSMMARISRWRCSALIFGVTGENLCLLILDSGNALCRDASYHGAGYCLVRCLSFWYPSFLEGYVNIFRTNFSRNTSDHLSKKAAYTEAIPYKTGIGILTPLELEAIHDAPASFFVSAHTHTSTMVGCMGPTSVGLVSSNASCENPVQSTASELLTSGGGYNPKVRGAFHMAVSARPYFVWRFMQCHEKQISLFTVTAVTEREARAQLPHAHLIFVARIRQEVTHA
ncbi:host cell division inhibitor Icd-like protein, partial [Escherichia coli]|uniref:host cell division inhibitor Icd-like protein n=1 Tax=Escherichia coli TaxID=562 RepID=UPI0040559A8F